VQKPVTHDQRLREARGETRATADRLYDRTRRRTDPHLKRAATIRGSARWKSLRAKKRRHNPLCEDHEARGKTVVATGVDHVKALEMLPHLAYVWSNLKSLCDPCHAKMSAAERRG